MTTVISIFNNKGGVGKTTLLWNLADSIARKGKRVLMVDFDPQCNLSIAVLGQLTFTGTLPTQNLPYGTTIRAYLQRFLQNTGGFEFFSHRGPHTHKNAELVAGDFWLNVYAESLSVGSDLLTGTGIAKYAVLRDMIDFANGKQIEAGQAPFDYAFVDLPPSFGALVRAALYASDYFIIPCTSDTFSSYCIGLIAEMLPIFTDDWKGGYDRFERANPQLGRYRTLGLPKFAGWIFNGFDTRGSGYVRADSIHADNIRASIGQNIINNRKISVADGLGEDTMIGDIEDMNVLVQNSIWQSVPVSQLDNFRPLKTLQDKGTWAPNQRDQIRLLAGKFSTMADNVIGSCV